MIVLVCVGFVIASDSAQQSKTDVRGCIKTKQDSPAKNVEVRCFYVDQNEFPWQVDTQVTNDLGQYTFHVLSNRKYFIIYETISSCKAFPFLSV